MRRSLLLWVVSGLAACAPDPDSLYFMTGHVIGADGAPAEGTPVDVTRSTDAYCTTPALLHAQADTYQPFASVDTATAGEFDVPVTYAELAPGFHSNGLPPCFMLSSGDVSSTTTLWFAFSAPTDITLPDLPHWSASLHATGDPASLSIDAAPLPGQTGDLPWTEQYVVRSGPHAVWSATPPSDGQVHVTPEILEDFAAPAAALRLISDSRTPSDTRPTRFFLPYSLQVDAPSTAVALSGRVPVSRGAPCPFPGAPDGPCPLTDGDLTPLSFYVPNDPSMHPIVDAIVVQLPATTQLRTVIARGFSLLEPGAVIHLIIEGSADQGRTWVALAAPLEVNTAELPDNGFGADGMFAQWDVASDAPPVSWIRARAELVNTLGPPARRPGAPPDGGIPPPDGGITSPDGGTPSAQPAAFASFAELSAFD